MAGFLAPPRDELLTLAVLEDVAAVLDRTASAVRGYAPAELTASLYRLQPPTTDPATRTNQPAGWRYPDTGVCRNDLGA